MPTHDDLLARALRTSEEALRRHRSARGKIQVLPKCAVRDLNDFAIWYTPGVAAPCKAIQADRETVYDYTNKANTIAVISDGTRVLGLGDIGPEAGLPVMEGKALLFKYLGGVDAVPLCLDTKDPDEFIRMVRILQPSFGAINLEDIAQPKCFRILEALRGSTRIPIWHDDQQGTATVLLAGLVNALEVVGKRLGKARIAMIGMGAANVPTYRMLKRCGADPANIVACDLGGILGAHRRDYERDEAYREQWLVCRETNPAGLRGGIKETLQGADVCVAFSAGGAIEPRWVAGMAKDAIVFACANPVPEIWPWEALEAGAKVVATGRSDFPNQVNNSLVFPAVFRGTLDVRASTITEEMALAAAEELARCARERGIHEQYILPRMDEWEVVPRVAVATALQAQAQGMGRVRCTAERLREQATAMITQAREATHLLMKNGLIPRPELDSGRGRGEQGDDAR